MNQLTQGIEYAIKNAIEEFSNRITSQYEGVDAEGLETIWNNVSEGMKISVTFKGIPTTNKSSISVNSPSKSETSEDASCPYAFTKGVNSGKTCGSKPSGGGSHCSRHKKHEGSEVKVKKTLPKAKSSSSTMAEKTTQKKSVPPAKPIERILKPNPSIGNKLWHKESGLVFRSDVKPPTAYAHFTLGQTETVPLTEEHILTCKQWQFAYESNTPSILVPAEAKNVKKTVNIAIAETSAQAKPTNLVSKGETTKKSIISEITKTTTQAKDVEDVLKELTRCSGNGNESEEEEEVFSEGEGTSGAKNVKSGENSEDEEYEVEEEEEFVEEEED